jgi:hypothetical protein
LIFVRISILMALFAVTTLFAETVQSDICVLGGTSAGVIAAVQAARMGKTVTLITYNAHLGGMTSSGLGWTDFGHVDNNTGDYIRGVAREFYDRVGEKYYGKSKTQFTFEPHVAEQVFDEMIKQAGVKVYTNQNLVSVSRRGQAINSIKTDAGSVFRAKMFIDATYTGDLMAAAGVSYTIGRESTNQYHESLNGVRLPNSDFTNYNVDPYMVTGNPASGLLPLIASGGPGSPGDADASVQAYTYRLCMTAVAANKIPITAPGHYNPAQFELLARYVHAMQAHGSSLSPSTFLTIQKVPNAKTDINNRDALSTDFIGESDTYAQADESTREKIRQAHKDYEQGFLYFLATDLRVPANLRAGMQRLGYCKDEFTDNAGWPYEFYVREARRMISDYVMTQSNVFKEIIVPDSIGEAGYFTDSHYCQRVVIEGQVRNEGNARGNIKEPYPISYRSIIPKASECSNLAVPVCVSASHTAYCSIRMEPVYMILGQSAATAAALAIDENVPLQKLNYSELRAHLLADGQRLN